MECVVCAYELADYLSFANLTIPKKIDEAIIEKIRLYSEPLSEIDYDITALKQELKNLMWDKAGILRNEKELQEALDTINEMSKDFKRDRKCLNKEEYEYRNMLTAAKLVVEAALMRKRIKRSACSY